MEWNKQKQIRKDYPVVKIGQAFLKEITMLPYNKNTNGQVFLTKKVIWEYIPTTTFRLYWMNKKTWIHEFVEIKWQYYLKENLDYPKTSFANYLLTQKWGVQFRPESVELEIKIWFEIRNKILQ
jgi:hypothetical protein